MTMTTLRNRIAATLIVAVAVVFSAGSAQALTLEDAFCHCADGARNIGDYVQCVAHCTKRLVDDGVLTENERATIIRTAHDHDLDLIALGCDCVQPNSGWGNSVDVDDATYAVGDVAEVRGRVWNMTDESVWLQGTNNCFGYAVFIYDELDNLLHRTFDPGPCGAAITDFELPPGFTEEIVLNIPLIQNFMGSGNLPPGLYTVEFRWDAVGPFPSDPSNYCGRGEVISSRIPINIGDILCE